MELKMESETFIGESTLKRYDVKDGTQLIGTLEDYCQDPYIHTYTALKGGMSVGSFTEESEALKALTS